MKTDALTALILSVGDESAPEHKAMFHLWSALDDVVYDRLPLGSAKARAERAMDAAADALAREESQ